MDDYFSGLTAPHINEMRLEEDYPAKVSNEKEDKRDEETREVTPVETKSEESFDFNSNSPPPSLSSQSPSHHSTNKSTSSTTSSTSSTSSNHQYISLKDYQPPHVNYQRESPLQSLVAVIGREFDEPQAIVKKLHSLVPLASNSTTPLLKLIPFTVRRSVLVKANFDWQELKDLDLVCMCYNASEARILLTGPDGFYTQLMKKLETVLGSNKIAFLITNYMSEIDSSPSSSSLIDDNLRRRLTAQTSLTTYLETNQVLSWFQDPCESHVTKLIELAHSEPNPSNFCLLL